MISGRKVLAKEKSVAAWALWRAQQILVDPGKGRRFLPGVEFPQDQEPETSVQTLRRNGMDRRRLLLQGHHHAGGTDGTGGALSTAFKASRQAKSAC